MAQINKPSEYFNTHLYSGNDTTNNQSVGLTPDLVWVKCRNVGSPTQHYIVDKVRGNEKYISSNATTAEQTDSNTFELVSGGFNLDGGNGWTNLTGRNYVAWNWLGGGTGVSNTDGSTTSTVSANQTSGFSIVKYTGNSTAGATVGHGLGVAPKVVIVKILNDSNQWCVYHGGLNVANPADYVTFFTSSASTNLYNIWNDTAPSSSVVTLGDNSACNTGNDYIAYCFAEKKSFSKFGSYTGNGNADGTFVYTGFKPAMVIYKRSDGVEGWMIQDNRRPGYNPMGGNLFPNNTNAESTDARFDFLSNGFKARSANQNTNTSTHIYMAFAEEPLVGTNNIPATAR